MSKFVLDKKHEQMYKRQMIKLLEKAVENLEYADRLYFEADMALDENKAAPLRKEAEELEKKAYSIMDMFPEFSINTIQQHRKEGA